MGQSANQGASTNSNGDMLDEFHAWVYAGGNNRLMSRFRGDWSDNNSFDWRCTQTYYSRWYWYYGWHDYSSNVPCHTTYLTK
jgi:hypothetical protein